MVALTKGIHHLGLTVSDIREAAEFFVGSLGHEVAEGFRSDHSCHVSDGVTLITLWQAQGARDARTFDQGRSVGLHHAAWLVETEALPELFETVTRWPGVRVELSLCATGGDMDASHFIVLMPGGPRIEFICSPAVPA